MTDQAINAEIAEVCGWQKHREIEEGHWMWVHPVTKLVCGQSLIPNYVEDLNAMHEVEKRLPKRLLTVYDDDLNVVVLRDCATRTELFPPNQAVYEDLSRWKFHATARQRAEAFLRTIGKWPE